MFSGAFRCALQLLFVGCLGLVTAASAQTRAAHVEPAAPVIFGAVSGHVYLAGSNAPARFVQIALQPSFVGSHRFSVGIPGQGFVDRKVLVLP